MRRALGLIVGITALWFLVLLAPAEASNCNTTNGTCFWIGGTGTLDLLTDGVAHWSNTTGGGACTCEPTSTSVLTFDGSSGGGTVTVTIAGGTLTVGQIVMGAFTGTLDFATSNNNVAINAFSGTGTGTRTLNMGNGTWTLSGGFVTPWDCTTVTNFTLNANSSTLAFGAVGINVDRSFITGGKTYNAVTMAESGQPKKITMTGNATFASLALTAPMVLTLASGQTITITNAFTWAGTAFNSVIMVQISGTGATISVASGTPSCSWCVIGGITFTGGATFTAPNSFSLGGNSGITITGPSGGSSGGGIIGG